MREHPNALVLGSREFTGEVPFKSRWGNRITRFVYALASGVHIGDTQTGSARYSGVGDSDNGDHRRRTL